MSKRIILVGGSLLLIGVALYLAAPAAPVAPPGAVVVTMEIQYKGNGDFKKVKVRASNGKWYYKPSRGYICYDETRQGECLADGDETQLVWKAVNLQSNERLRIEAKESNAPNSAIFLPQTLDQANPEKNVGGPIPPLSKKSNGKYYDFEYDVRVLRDDIEIGVQDPDIMPHGPRGRG